MNVNARDYLDSLAKAWENMEASNSEGTVFSLNSAAEETVSLCLSSGKKNGKIILIGNGGSAASVSHMQNDFCKAVGLRAIVFNEPPLLTALTNDDGYETAFESCVELWGEPGDVLFSVSSSGESENILRASEKAKLLGCTLITLSGFDSGNNLRRLGDINFYVPSFEYGLVEIAHSAFMHFITDRAAQVK